MPTITLPDGSQRSFDHAVSVADVALSIGAGLAKATVAGKVDGKLVDACDLIENDASLQIITPKDAEGWRSSVTPALTWWGMRSSSCIRLQKWSSAR
ncbi:hypothetical protein PSA5_19945 [Pseudomonas syringae pv. actinidiae]|nr:hypothetical protein PSA5_19945 [Pseudomonas syringae pv. actinidiae]